MPVLTLCIIVKNEELHLRDCLDSVKDAVDEIVVVDTGSTDKTIQIAEEYGAKIYNFEWVSDFSAARNFALGKSTGNWVLYLDADEKLSEQSKSELIEIINNNESAGYYCTVISVAQEKNMEKFHRCVRLFANSPEIKFSGRVHEQIVPSLTECGYKLIATQIIIHNHGDCTSVQEKKLKASGKLQLLLKDFEATKAPYYAFQLAQTYDELEDDENASLFFKIASESSKLDKHYRAYSYSSLANISFKSRKIQDAEKYIIHAMKIDDKQPFPFMLASEISLQKGELTIAEDRAKRAYILNQALLVKAIDCPLSLSVNSEKIIYYGLILSLRSKNNLNYTFYQKELFALFASQTGVENSPNSIALEKVFGSLSFSPDDVEIIARLINNRNLSFYIYMLGVNPYKQQVMDIVKKLLDRFSDSVEVKKLYARMLEEFGKVDEAVGVMESIIGDNKTDPTIFFYLISFYLKQGKDDKIKPLVLQLEKHFSHIPDVMSRVRTLKRKLLMLTSVPL